MESRLPKPRPIGLKKPKMENMDINIESKMNLGTLKDTSAADNTTESVSTSSLVKSTSVRAGNSLKTIVKSKSTLGINNVKATNENKAPVKPLLTRSETSVAIARRNVASKVSVKRLGTTTASSIETKRGKIGGTIVKPITSQRDRTNGVVGGATSDRTARIVSGGAKINGKPNKWDFKGRFELAAAELASLREKHKKCAHLESTVDALRAKETGMTMENDELKNSIDTLTDELTRAKDDNVVLLTEIENLKDLLKLSEESSKRIEEALKKSETTCESQKKIITEHDAKIESFMINHEKDKLTINELTKKNIALQSLLSTMDKDRRLLHNAIQELKGNIRVFCRVRPRITNESSRGLCTINFIDECTMEIGRNDIIDGSIANIGGKTRSKQEFSFDKIFPPGATQAQVFEELSLLVQSALEGYNVCIFAYGQTGSGKTYTMEGGRDSETEGMIPRTVRHIFAEMKELELLGWNYKIEASFLEIYNEHIHDLLDSQQKTHDIRMADSKGHDLYVTNLKVEEIHSPEELNEALRTAQQNRAVAATFANERSSRSHSVARIRLIGTHTEKDEISIGNLNLVDLAGSERLKGEEAVRTTETKNINKSLANLGNVILALLKKQDHVPYRNSKLTHLLMPSLGGNSKTLMLLNVSPLDECYNETLNSLRFASNVNSCKTGNVKRSRTIMHNSM